MSALSARVRRLLAFPPQAEESEAARRMRLLDVFLAISASATAVFLLASGPAMDPRARVLCGILLAACLALSVLNRRGFTRLAAVSYLSGVWLFVTASFWLFGTWRTPAASAYAVVALAAALLFGVRGASTVSALVAASCIFIAFADAHGWPPPARPPGSWISLSVLLASLLSVVGMALYATAELQGAISGLRTEVQERRVAEERLRESEGRFRSIVEASPMGIHLYRLESPDRLVLTGSNPTGDRILGVPWTSLAGRTIEEGFPGLAGTAVPAAYRRLCTEGGAWTSEVHYRDERFGGVYEVHAFQTAPGMMAAMFLDVTERRRAEEERRRLEEQLRQAQKMEAVGRLAGGIAHDFNNLLMVIMGHGELLRRSLEADDPRLKKLQHVMAASEKAARLVRQLLAFSRKQVLEPQVVDLNALVSDTARMLRPLLGEDVHVVADLRSVRGQVRVDPAQIDQVLVNLAVNARDAMPGGGTLSLETEDVEGPQGRAVALTVRDTGLGMDDRIRAQAFEPFFTTKGASGGTGLGLSMVYGIVQQSGGQIEVRSEPGQGASFRILLPRADGPGPAPEREAAAAPAPGGGETVLVVEDEPAIRSLACEMLEAHGYRALEAGSGEEALALARLHEGPIHLLVTDVVMPGLAGPSLAGRFTAVRPEARVLFMSGYAGDELARRGVADDAAHFLPKPFTADVLSRRVREALDR
ncbi:MAG TPA: ATP-binding protein [Vicinamibacteria bacterium]|nr:ATP-binding protein [Vicinamibacteria bacterium]